MTTKRRRRGPRIGVLMGGVSAEREVSLNTGAGVLAALRSRGHDCVGLDWRAGQSLGHLLEAARVDVVWNALHGTLGEDGAVQGTLACLGIPGTGSGILASALAMDKVASKSIFEVHEIPTPEWAVLQRADDATATAWLLPIVIKPAREGSSVGVSIVRSQEELSAAVEEARKHEGPTLIERFIPGREIHVGILDDAVLGDVEVRPHRGFYDYAAKYTSGDTEYVVPAPISDDERARVHEVSLDAFRALGCSSYGRVDVRLDVDGEPWVLEVNTLPGMTATSLMPKIAGWAGMDYAELCERILAGAQ